MNEEPDQEMLGEESPSPSPSPEPASPERRAFLTKAACALTGGVIVGVPIGAGLGSLLAPLGGPKETGLKVRLAAVDDLPSDGAPRAYQVVDQPSDSWIKYGRKSIGEVLLRRLPDGKVSALSSTCPHAGCGVSYRSEENDLHCPCHASQFALDGERLGADNKSPRSLDELEVDAEKLAEGEIWVTFQRFRTGIEAKEVVS